MVLVRLLSGVVDGVVMGHSLLACGQAVCSQQTIAHAQQTHRSCDADNISIAAIGCLVVRDMSEHVVGKLFAADQQIRNIGIGSVEPVL